MYFREGTIPHKPLLYSSRQSLRGKRHNREISTPYSNMADKHTKLTTVSCWKDSANTKVAFIFLNNPYCHALALKFWEFEFWEFSQSSAEFLATFNFYGYCYCSDRSFIDAQKRRESSLENTLTNSLRFNTFFN